MAKLLGRGQITIGGLNFRVRKGTTIEPGGVKRTTRNGARRVNGYTEETVNSKVELTVDIGAEFSIAQVGALADVDCHYLADTGQSWVIPNCWVTDPPPIDENEGTAKITIEGEPVQES